MEGDLPEEEAPDIFLEIRFSLKGHSIHPLEGKCRPGSPTAWRGRRACRRGAAGHPSRGHPEPLQRLQVVIVRSVKSVRDPAGGGSCGLYPLVQKQDADSHPGQVAGLRLHHYKVGRGDGGAWEPSGNSDRGLVGCLQGNPQKPGGKIWAGNLSCSGSRPQTRLGPGTWRVGGQEPPARPSLQFNFLLLMASFGR